MEKTSISRLIRCWLFDFGFWVLWLPETMKQLDRRSVFTGSFYLRRLLWHIWLLVTAVITLWMYNLGDTASLLAMSISSQNLLWGNYVPGSPAVAFISQWSGHYFGWLQHLWSWRRTVQCVEPDIHRWWPEKDCRVSFFHPSFRLLDLITREGTREHTHYVQDLTYFLNLPMVEARDFHCHSHVFENLGYRTTPSDHAAVRLVIQKPTLRGHPSKRIPSWMSKHHFLFPSAAGSKPPKVLSLSVLCAHRVYSQKSTRFVSSHEKHLTVPELSS